MGELSDPKLIRKEVKGRVNGCGIKEKKTAMGAERKKTKGWKMELQWGQKYWKWRQMKINGEMWGKGKVCHDEDYPS